jgi:hypothetical protein
VKGSPGAKDWSRESVAWKMLRGSTYVAIDHTVVLVDRVTSYSGGALVHSSCINTRTTVYIFRKGMRY